MKNRKLKEILIVISIIVVLIILLLIFGFVSSAAEKPKTPEFDKFLVTTNFPLNDYTYEEKQKPTDLSKILKVEESKEEEKKELPKETFKEKVEDLKSNLLDKQEKYTKDIFQSNEEIQKQQLEKKRRNILSSLISNTPKIKVEKNSFNKVEKKELDYGDSSFSNLKNKNSVTNETKLYRTITSDKRIPVILTSSINSSLSGQVIGIVEEDIYASMGTAKLIPKGSKAIGDYKNNSQIGENRFKLRWERFITPHGVHILLDNAQSADIKGNSGVLGVVDDRYWERYGIPLTLSTLSNSILLAVSKATSDNSSKNNSNNTQIILDNSRQDLSYIMKKIIDEQVKIKPIIKVREASRVFIVSKYDIWFPQPKDGEILVKYYNLKGERNEK